MATAIIIIAIMYREMMVVTEMMDNKDLLYVEPIIVSSLIPPMHHLTIYNGLALSYY